MYSCKGPLVERTAQSEGTARPAPMGRFVELHIVVAERSLPGSNLRASMQKAGFLSYET